MLELSFSMRIISTSHDKDDELHRAKILHVARQKCLSEAWNAVVINEFILQTAWYRSYFVDFSRYNIRLFTNKEWIHYLTRTDLRLVLIADRFTHPLALYWKKQCQQIAAVISVDDTKKEIQRKIQLHFFGGKVGENTQPKLSDIEVQILELMIAEKSVKRIADELSLSEKRIYAIKLSLQNKMGGRGRLNIMLSG